MNKKLLIIAFSALLLGAAFGIWFFGANDLVSQVAKMKIKDIPTSNLILAACVPIVALIGLLSGWNESTKNNSE